MSERREWNVREALELRNAGKQWEEVGSVFGLSGDAVRCRLRRAVGSTPAELDARSAQQRLEDQVRELRTKLREADRYHGMVREMVGVVESAYEPLEPVHTTEPLLNPSADDVDGVVMWSDQHADRVVQSEGVWGLDVYDFDVFRARLWRMVEVLRDYSLVHLPNYTFDTLWVLHLGDAVNGDIHDAKLRNHFGNSIRAALATGDVQAQALQYLLGTGAFKRIVVVCVSGNHGRTTKGKEFDDPHDNLDYLVAATMAQRLHNEPNISIIAPNSWSAFVRIRGKLCELNHGDGVRGWGGIPWYGFDRREGRVRAIAAMKREFIDYHFYGHYHTPMVRPSGLGRAVHAGAWYMTDPYALNAVVGANEPEQQFLMFSERFGRQMEIPIFPRVVEREEAMRRGEWEPPLGRKTVVDDITPETPGLVVPIIEGGEVC